MKLQAFRTRDQILDASNTPLTYFHVKHNFEMTLEAGIITLVGKGFPLELIPLSNVAQMTPMPAEKKAAK